MARPTTPHQPKPAYGELVVVVVVMMVVVISIAFDCTNCKALLFAQPTLLSDCYLLVSGCHTFQSRAVSAPPLAASQVNSHLSQGGLLLRFSQRKLLPPSQPQPFKLLAHTSRVIRLGARYVDF